MSNYTQTYWSWNGTSLETYAWGIEELGDARGGPPPLRGEDVLIPGRPGRLFQPKVADSRVITLTMWVNGTDANGVVVDVVGFRNNMRALRSLLWDPAAQGDLTKRWRTSSGGAILSATAKAQFAGGLTYELENNDRDLAIARTTVDLMLADPFFYGDTDEFVAPVVP